MSSWANRWRKDFRALSARGASGVAYLDSACMSLVPSAVIDAMREYYSQYPGCGGRSVHRWSTQVTEKVEDAREAFGRFLGAPPSSLINVRNTTEAINLVARGLSLKKGSRVLITDQEHNSNLVVWQMLKEIAGIRLEFLSLPEERPLDIETYERALERGVHLVSFFHSSNLDGRTLPAREVVERAHDHGAIVLLDGSQAAPHQRLELKKMGVDFYALSFHKMLGPTGTGLLYSDPARMTDLSPLVVGGETIAWADYDSHELLPGPERFEAGLQNYAGILGARVGVSYLDRVDFQELASHEHTLQTILEKGLSGIDIQRIGLPDARDRGAVFSFAMPGVDPHDVALFLDEGYAVLVRSGMNCVNSWYRSRGLEGSVRASFYLYTTEAEVRRLVSGVLELVELTQAGPRSK